METSYVYHTANTPLIARFMGPTWGPSGADRTQVGPMLAPWRLLSGSNRTRNNKTRTWQCHQILAVPPKAQYPSVDKFGQLVPLYKERVTEIMVQTSNCVFILILLARWWFNKWRKWKLRTRTQSLTGSIKVVSLTSISIRNVLWSQASVIFRGCENNHN